MKKIASSLMIGALISLIVYSSHTSIENHIMNYSNFTNSYTGK